MRKIIFLSAFAFVLFSLLTFGLAEDTPANVVTSEGSFLTATTTTSTDTVDVGNAQTETSSTTESSFDKSVDAGQAISEEQVVLKTEAGMTPDNPIYFVKDTYQRLTVGSDPEKALNYKEQKIAEAEAMIEKGNPAQAEKVLDRAMQYSDIVEREASPEMNDKVQESGAAVENTIRVMEEKTIGTEWQNVRQKFNETLQKEKEIGSAAELAAKINELCVSLSQLDPLQYADTCKPNTNSPKWMQVQDKQMTAEQESKAKIFFEKISQCFESPEKCDCKGIGVQKFESFCLEKSVLAVKCNQGDESACKEAQSGSDPTDLLPDYLVPVLNQVQAKYTAAQYDMYMPRECTLQGAKTPEACSKIMFRKTAPKECIDAGLTGKSKEDEIKCEKIMFEKNTPQECIDAGITSSDADAPRKCARIMFTQRAPQDCINAGITGEGRGDEKKCRQLTGGSGNMGLEQNASQNRPKFNRDCNKIQDANEKVKCYEEFYNNAQVQFSENFVQKGAIDSHTGETITSEEESARKQCLDKGMNTILEYEGGKRIVICVDKGQVGVNGGRCQSQTETEKLKQDCQSRGQGANVEMRNGCPWVICINGDFRGDYAGTEVSTTYASGTGPNQQQQSNVVNQQTSQNSDGIKCPDSICDSYEKMNPWACPEDCGGTRQPGNQPPQEQQSPNIISQPQQPDQSQQNFCSGVAPNCDSTGSVYCQNGNWVCPQPPQEQAQQQTQQEPQQMTEQQPQISTGPSPEPEPIPSPEPAPTTEPSPASEPSVTITGGVIASIYGDENSRGGDSFLGYWFKR